MSPDNWEILESHEVFRAASWIWVEQQSVRLPDGRRVDDYYQIGLPDCVVIYAETDDGRVIVQRQYRHGPRRVALCLPAGSVELSEAPLDCAKRELKEEAGYVSDRWEILGSFALHGNYGCGTLHMFAARGARFVAAPCSGDLEQAEVLLMEPLALTQAVLNGDMPLMGCATAVLAAACRELVRDA